MQLRRLLCAAEKPTKTRPRVQINVLYEGVTLSQALLIKDHISLHPAHSVILIETHHIDLVKAERSLEKWKGFGIEKGFW